MPQLTLMWAAPSLLLWPYWRPAAGAAAQPRRRTKSTPRPHPVSFSLLPYSVFSHLSPYLSQETTMNARGSPASKRRSSIKPHPLSSPLCTGSSPKPAVATRTSWSSPSPGVPSPSTSSDQQDRVHPAPSSPLFPSFHPGLSHLYFFSPFSHLSMFSVVSSSSA